MFNLETLLDPIMLDQFLREHWTCKGLVIHTQTSGRFRSLFSWDDLNHLVNFHKLRFLEDIRFASVGQKIRDVSNVPRDWVKQCQEGHTLIINQLQARLPAIAELASMIENDIGHRTHVNMYCSWPEQQGFDLHHDDHEVFILQIDGTKRWFVFEDTYRFPLEKYATASVDSPKPNSPPYIETVLHPGDLLYIPRGHWHYAVACDEPSLHLTLGVTCRTGVYWLKWLADELMKEPEWRRNLPPVVKGNTDQVGDHIRGLIERLAALAGDEIVRAYIANHLTAQGTRHEESGLPSQSGFHPLSGDGETPLRRARFQPVRVEHDPGSGTHWITTRTKKITLAGVSVEFIDNVFNRETFTIKEVAGWAPDLDLEEDIIPLLQQLIEEGIFLVDINHRTDSAR